MAKRVGFFQAASRNPSKDGPFQPNSHSASDLAFADSFVGSRLFASVFSFCQRNDTRNDTRREGLRELQCQRIFGDVATSSGASRQTRLEPGRPSNGLCGNDDVFGKRRGDWNGLLVFN